MTKRYRVVNKFRFTVFVVLMILLIATFANFALGHSTADSLTRTEYMNLKVSDGDTLWSIAKTYMADSGDIRQSVYELCQLNGISADELYAGMKIQVPVQVA